MDAPTHILNIIIYNILHEKSGRAKISVTKFVGRLSRYCSKAIKKNTIKMTQILSFCRRWQIHILAITESSFFGFNSLPHGNIDGTKMRDSHTVTVCVLFNSSDLGTDSLRIPYESGKSKCLHNTHMHNTHIKKIKIEFIFFLQTSHACQYDMINRPRVEMYISTANLIIFCYQKYVWFIRFADKINTYNISIIHIHNNIMCVDCGNIERNVLIESVCFRFSLLFREYLKRLKHNAYDNMITWFSICL